MAKKEIVSIFTVTELKTGKQIEEAIIGCGQEAIRYLRKQYPKFTKFVLEWPRERGNPHSRKWQYWLCQGAGDTASNFVFSGAVVIYPY